MLAYVFTLLFFYIRRRGVIGANRIIGSDEHRHFRTQPENQKRHYLNEFGIRQYTKVKHKTQVIQPFR
jgi:hypothetical protein